MTRKQLRLVFIGGALAVMGAAVGLMLYGCKDSVALFMSPTEIVEKDVAPGARLRVGGLVANGSTTKTAEMLTFSVTDGAHELGVDCAGECFAADARPVPRRPGRRRRRRAGCRRIVCARTRFSPNMTSATCRARSSRP